MSIKVEGIPRYIAVSTCMSHICLICFVLTIAGIVCQGKDNYLFKNLVGEVHWPGAWYPGVADEDVAFTAGIDTTGSTRISLHGNVVAGSERSGIQLDGEECKTTVSRWRDNIVHSVLIGVWMTPMINKPPPPGNCTLVAGISVYMAYDVGIYLQSRGHIIITNVTTANCHIGLFTFAIGPKPLGLKHRRADTKINVTHSCFMGMSKRFDCKNDHLNLFSTMMTKSLPARSWCTAKNKGTTNHPTTEGNFMAGIVVATFSSAPNKAPEKPFYNVMGYNTIGGQMNIQCKC